MKRVGKRQKESEEIIKGADLILSKRMESETKTPVRPTPALQWTEIGPS